MIRFLTLVWILVLFFSSLYAGETQTFKAKGRTFSIPGFVEIRTDNKILFKDKDVRPWSKQNSYSHLSVGPYTFITIRFNDGIDIDQKRLFSIRGNTVIEHPVLTSNEEDALFMESGSLYYWSSSFCGFKDPKNKTENSYVLEFKNNKFERRPIDIPAYHNCEVEFIKKQL